MLMKLTQLERKTREFNETARKKLVLGLAVLVSFINFKSKRT